MHQKVCSLHFYASYKLFMHQKVDFNLCIFKIVYASKSLFIALLCIKKFVYASYKFF
ncbi:hypothetical protein NBO_4g0018 [Nosema bombycis CQ1]|uniref:Uncharacterized protein n=1 Tax=Nosema bombycis (strain CQ1 / CVCC 102059) TaxID=578461 RepID=R0MMH3_NOSB1|nr:hypothetical protein NBO_4g0018 [Nosema bombycis CQ1]|eukprot:EOB15390.1 hypothetical protein NBO_4g0018 [Nosema bombycis CQ1]